MILWCDTDQGFSSFFDSSSGFKYSVVEEFDHFRVVVFTEGNCFVLFKYQGELAESRAESTLKMIGDGLEEEFESVNKVSKVFKILQGGFYE